MATVPPLEVRRAPLPCYRPFVILRTDTNKVVAWYKSKAEAERDLKAMRAGILAWDDSPIQQTSDPIQALESRMTNPFGDKPRSAIRPGRLGRRDIRI